MGKLKSTTAWFIADANVLIDYNGWSCLTNDGPLREACNSQGISVVWGLEIMLQLVEAGHVSAAKVIEVAESIHS